MRAVWAVGGEGGGGWDGLGARTGARKTLLFMAGALARKTLLFMAGALRWGR